MISIKERFKRSWNAFRDRDPTESIDIYSYPVETSISSSRPDRVRLSTENIRSLVAAMYDKISTDVAQIDIRHVRVDEDGNFKGIIRDELNRCLSLEANLDQTGRNLIRDIVISLFDEGSVAVVPTICDFDPEEGESYKIYELRVGEILQWRPDKVLVRVYNEDTGNYEQILFPKRTTAILENPFYEIMNEPNSVKQRLMRVLAQIDKTNNQASSGKLDMIIKLPYAVKNPTKLALAKARQQDLEDQLSGSQLGIGYIDATEQVIQLNRSLGNNLWDQAIELTKELYSQLGFSQGILDNTADEQTMINYNNRTLEPVLNEIVEQMERKWISITAQSQGQAIRYFRDPFKLVPLSKIAEIADTFRRNEIMESNEIRGKLGLKPSKDPRANELANPNLNHPDEVGGSGTSTKEMGVEESTDEISK